MEDCRNISSSWSHLRRKRKTNLISFRLSVLNHSVTIFGDMLRIWVVKLVHKLAASSRRYANVGAKPSAQVRYVLKYRIRVSAHHLSCVCSCVCMSVLWVWLGASIDAVIRTGTVHVYLSVCAQECWLERYLYQRLYREPIRYSGMTNATL